MAVYLAEARAAEEAIAGVLEEHLTVTPPGRYREAVERHALHHYRHVAALSRRMADLGVFGGRDQDRAGGVVPRIFAQILQPSPPAGSAGDPGLDRLLKNAMETCALEALVLSIYDAIEELAGTVLDEQSGTLAGEICAEEQAMLSEMRDQVAALTDTVVRYELGEEAAYDLSGADAVAPAERVDEPALAGRYETLPEAAALAELAGLSSGELVELAAHERTHQARPGMLRAIREAAVAR